jgi:hypothetical protein
MKLLTLIPESIKLSAMVIGVFLIYSFNTSYEYLETLDKPRTIIYDCRILMGSWHPDVPRDVIEACKQKGQISVKINKRNNITTTSD